MVLTPIFVYKEKQRHILFGCLLLIFISLYWQYAEIDPLIYSLHLLPLCLVTVILYAGLVPAVLTGAILNLGCGLVLDYYWQPALLSSAFLVIGSYFIRNQLKRMNLVRKLAFSISMMVVYHLLYALLSPAGFASFFTLYALYTIMFTFISLWGIIYLLYRVKQYEFHRQQLVALEKDRMIGQLAATISHEIRNPLTSIRGFLQLLERKELSMYDHKRYVELAMSGVDQANTIINDYLNYAKPSSGLQEQLDVREELEAMLRFITPFATDHGVVIETTHESEGPLYILGESKKLRQCLMNLVKNGIESMPDGGTITLRTCRMPDAVQISITDTGVGMTPAQLNSLGVPFYTTKEQGTGLGLLVVMSIIKMMNGTITFNSAINQGTQCSIHFHQK
ncbi:ATP-binding protein [Paenibacillus sp. GCM10023248]|nr:ATP-binding protein [Paenibacillus sp. MAHUQ-63]